MTIQMFLIDFIKDFLTIYFPVVILLIGLKLTIYFVIWE